MSTDGVYRRILRRETHASRAVPAIIVAAAAAIALAWLVTETVLAALGRSPLLLAPTSMLTGVAGLPSAPVEALTGGGIGLALIGVGLVVLAITAGRLGRHVIPNDRAAVVVHDQVIGSALARTAANVSATDPDLAAASVGTRRATVRITPTSGTDIDRAAVQQAVSERLDGFGLAPAMKTRVVVVRKGEVSA